jgi:hypothetical protein
MHPSNLRGADSSIAFVRLASDFHFVGDLVFAGAEVLKWRAGVGGRRVGYIGCLQVVGVGLAGCDAAHTVSAGLVVSVLLAGEHWGCQGVWARLRVALVTGAGARAERQVSRVVKTIGMVVGGEG